MWTLVNNEFLAESIGQHDDWVRDVSWCNNIGLTQEMIASCSEDQKCKIFKREGKAKWACMELGDFNVPLWKVSWS